MDITDIEDSARKITDRIQPQIDDAKRRFDDVNERVSAFVQDHPGACLLGAIALGYAIARLARRQRS
jgi:hypothetical protein